MIAKLTAENVVFFTMCATAVWLDLRYRRLPNWLCLLTLVIGLGLTLVFSGMSVIWSHLAHAGVALILGMALFSIQIVGGGDGKFYAAVASWFALSDAPRLLLNVSLCGLVLFLAWFAFRRLTRQPISRPGGSDFGKFPYGLAIATGAFWAYIVA